MGTSGNRCRGPMSAGREAVPFKVSSGAHSGSVIRGLDSGGLLCGLWRSLTVINLHFSQRGSSYPVFQGHGFESLSVLLALWASDSVSQSDASPSLSGDTSLWHGPWHFVGA